MPGPLPCIRSCCTGDDPPRDRTSELRKKGFQGRRLGPKQMTTDTAVRVRPCYLRSKFMCLIGELTVDR